ncbi:hypothetical protein MWU60_18710 [Yoonia sp. F2084L]|uniref:hypothetical protein n=1 Tax=Yoonia sp. F2084L TaxID=2926419 RepID=UPI001FF12CA3|nr:hypothetical protein [Yoonia sp. F2084L]MCK0097614.1 hypothetical protein [Yoonia sp. F2084L]
MTLSRILLTLSLVLFTLPAFGQNFSCSIGTRPSCLGFGDTVCSSSGQCVDQAAQCFNRYQCNFEGFTCKSNVTACVNDYDDLLRTHNTLVDDFNGLLQERDRLRDDLREMLNVVRDLEEDLENVQSCLIFASTFEDAQFCMP